MTRLGIIGTGWGARVHVPAFRAAGLDVVAIAGHDATKTAKIASELSLRAHRDWRSLIDSEVDLVTIVTPPSTHREIAIAALRAGKHVLSEKPTAMNAAEAEEMLQVANDHPQQVALIDHELRFLPSWIAAREHIARLGGIRFIEMRFSSPSRGDRNRAWNWWSDGAHGGGVLGAIGSHAVDAIRYLTGNEIVCVQAVLNTFIQMRPSDEGSRVVTSDDFAAVHLRLDNRALATLTFSVVSAVDEPTTITVHGEGGGVRLVAEDLLTAQSSGTFERVNVDSAHPPGLAGNSAGGAFGTGSWYLGRALANALTAADRQALAPAATFEDGLLQQRILDAARRSHAANGAWTDV